MRIDVRRLYLANFFFLFLCGMVCGVVAGAFCDKYRPTNIYLEEL